MGLCSRKMWKSNAKNIFHIISHIGLWSEVMPSGSSSIIVQSLKTLQQNGPKLQNISNNSKYMF